jgi:8-oxo-dGTP pyrophosphatase MutT (NUDIX family)
VPNRAFFRTTWDGLFISEEPPHGVTVIVLRRDKGTVSYLVLHRADAVGDGTDWEWGPPAAVRLPGESVDACGRRTLDEATGLSLPIRPVGEDQAWAAYWSAAPATSEIALSPDHDRFEWVPLAEAIRLCQPAIVGEQFQWLAAMAAA